MDDESSLLKIKLYLFHSAGAEQQQDQQQLSFEEKKGGSSTRQVTYASGLTIGRKPYGLKIKPANFSKRLGMSNQFLDRQCYKGGDGKHSVQFKSDVTERLRTPWNSPGEEHLTEDQGSTRTRQASSQEEAERSDKGLQDLQ